MKRRDLLQAAGLTAISAFASGCAGHRTTAATQTPPPPKPARAAVNLAVPRISWERVIRTTVGLRPHRDSGFVLKPEKFDAKTVIHDYGFGGAGMSLAWGCGAMAADMALQQGERRAAVLGCGSPGLTAARQLQRRGFEVTIYTMAVPPYTTSNMSAAGFTPNYASQGPLLPWAYNVPIALDRVLAIPGDIMIADDDGAVIVPAAMAAMVAEHTVKHEDWEEFSRMKLAEGGSLRRYYPLDEAGEAEYEAWRQQR